MKKILSKKCVIIIGIIFMFIMMQLSISGMEVVNSYSIQSADYNQQKFSLVLNTQRYFYDDEELAEIIINGYVENSLDGMLFSFDENGYPEILEVSVYKNMNDFSNDEVEFGLECILVCDSEYEYEINIY